MRLCGRYSRGEPGNGDVDRGNVDGQPAESRKAQLASQRDCGRAHINRAVSNVDRCRWTRSGRVVIKDNTR